MKAPPKIVNCMIVSELWLTFQCTRVFAPKKNSTENSFPHNSSCTWWWSRANAKWTVWRRREGSKWMTGRVLLIIIRLNRPAQPVPDDPNDWLQSRHTSAHEPWCLGCYCCCYCHSTRAMSLYPAKAGLAVVANNMIRSPLAGWISQLNDRTFPGNISLTTNHNERQNNVVTAEQQKKNCSTLLSCCCPPSL